MRYAKPMTETPALTVDLAPGCVCGACDPACRYLPFKSCCGACMDGSPFAGEETPAEAWARITAYQTKENQK